MSTLFKQYPTTIIQPLARANKHPFVTFLSGYQTRPTAGNHLG